MYPVPPHQYVERSSGRIITETLVADRLIRWLYSVAREKAPVVFKALTSAHSSQLFSYFQFDCPTRQCGTSTRKLAVYLNINLRECVDPAHCLQSARHLFERQIKYWECRPMPDGPERIVSPADAKLLVGSLDQTDILFLKEKLFTYAELIGPGKPQWRTAFEQGAFAVLRLTPEKYHYNHFPVSGQVVDHYSIDGAYHSCNPTAVVEAVTPYSKNKRIVTIIDTDVSGGTGVGLVAMVEVVALMIGDIVQCYSRHRYDAAEPIQLRQWVQRGQPKSLFRPGSSTDVLFFQKNRMEFDKDLVCNCLRRDVYSRFSLGFQQPLVETDVRVRASIGRRRSDAAL